MTMVLSLFKVRGTLLLLATQLGTPGTWAHAVQTSMWTRVPSLEQLPLKASEGSIPVWKGGVGEGGRTSRVPLFGRHLLKKETLASNTRNKGIP